MQRLPKGVFYILISLILLLGMPSIIETTVSAEPYYRPQIKTLNDQLQKVEKSYDPKSPDGGKNILIDKTAIAWSNWADILHAATGSIGCIETPEFDSTLTQINGKPNLEYITGRIKDTQDKCNKLASSNALAFLSTSMTSIYDNPPAGLAWYIKDTMETAGFAKPVYAQGIGFTALGALLPIWKAMRNIAYSIIVIVMVAIGFMIIFRMKIDPKTIISVQAALPKIIITLLLVTFSYAIAGFLIDLMYLSIGVAIGILAPAMGDPFSSQVTNLQSQYMTGGLGRLAESVFGGGFEAVPELFGNLLLPYAPIGGGLAVFGVLTAPLAIWLLPFAAFSVPLIFLFIVFLGLLFTFIRLFLLLLNSYIQVLVAIILGPLLLLQEAIPGRSAFGGWVLNLIANLSVFPATVILLLFSLYLNSRSILEGPGGTTFWAAPLIHTGQSGFNAFPAFLGLGIIFLAPNLVASIKKVFQPKPTVPISAGTMLSPLTGAVGTGMGAMSNFYYMQQVMNTGALAGFLGKLRGKKSE